MSQSGRMPPATPRHPSRERRGPTRSSRRLPRQQSAYMLDKRVRVRALKQARPLHLAKLLRHPCLQIGRAIDDDREQESPIPGHVARTIDGELPLTAKVAFLAFLCVRRNHRHEQVTALDLLPDGRIPAVAAAKFTLVEPHRDARIAQDLTKTLGGPGVLRRIAEEYGPAGIGHSAVVTEGLCGFSGSARSAMRRLSTSVPLAYPKL